MNDETDKLLALPWYTLEQPWCHSDQAGTLIMAGSEDPHVAIPICETDDIDGENYDRETAVTLARHIVELHNAHLNIKAASADVFVGASRVPASADCEEAALWPNW